jgi:hypothetical protein
MDYWSFYLHRLAKKMGDSTPMVIILFKINLL